MKLALIGSMCLITAIIAGALWIYLMSGGVEPQSNVVADEAGKPDDVIEHAAKPQVIPKVPLTKASPDADLASRIAAVEARLAPLADRIAGLERGVRDNAAAARIAGERAHNVAGLFDEAKKSVDAQNSPQQQERGAPGGLGDRLKILESEQASLNRRQDELDHALNATVSAPDRAVRVAVVAAALRDAVERDVPFAAELAAARSLGLDRTALASLEPFAATGVPTQRELSRELSALVPELLHASVPTGRDLGYLDRLQASAAKMLNIRPVRDEPGEDPTTVIGRIEFKIAKQDITGIMAELDKLPASAKELALPWRAKVLARQGALESARLLATASVAKLGE